MYKNAERIKEDIAKEKKIIADARFDTLVGYTLEITGIAQFIEVSKSPSYGVFLFGLCAYILGRITNDITNSKRRDSRERLSQLEEELIGRGSL